MTPCLHPYSYWNTLLLPSFSQLLAYLKTTSCLHFIFCSPKWTKFCSFFPSRACLLAIPSPLYFSEFSPIHQNCLEFCSWDLPVGGKHGMTSLFAVIHSTPALLSPHVLSLIASCYWFVGSLGFPVLPEPFLLNQRQTVHTPLALVQLMVLPRVVLCFCLYWITPYLFQIFDPVSQALTKF